MQSVPRKKRRARSRRWIWVAALAVAAAGIAVAVVLTSQQANVPAITKEDSSGILMQHETNEVASFQLTLRDGESYTLLQDSAGALTVAGDESFTVASTYQESLLSAVSILSYTDVLADDWTALQEYLSEFGLDTPQVSVHVAYTDGTEATFHIGNASPLEDESWYYMTVDGDPRLFALDKGTAEDLMVHLASLREITQPTIHRARLDAITFTGAGGEITAQWLLDGDITDADAASNWRMTVPYAYPAEESAMTALRKNLTNLRLGAYVTEATAENLTAYGLDTPQFTLTLHMAAGATGVTNDDGTYATKDWPESTFVLKIGNAKSDMVDYVQVDNGIYLCSHFSLATFRDLNPKDTISRYPLMVSLDDVVGLTVTDSSGITTYTLTREEQVAENNELVRDSNGNIQYNVTCLCNGEEMSYDVFAAQWEQLAALRVTGWLPDGYEVTADAHTSLVFTTISGKVHTLSFAPYDALHDAVMLDNTALFYVIRE